MLFKYVGPEAIRLAARGERSGTVVTSYEDLRRWLASDQSEALAEAGWCTYVVDASGALRLAPRRTEHVACAAGADVRAAGEIQFDESGAAVEVSNHSTGYCPAEDCWEAVRQALDRAGVARPEAFTFLAVFRRCRSCGERNLVKDDWFLCELCDAELPEQWNFGDEGPSQ